MEKLLKETVDNRIDEFQFWNFDDLQARRVVSSRTDLHRKQKYFGFPKSIHLTAGRRPAAVFKAVEVIEWCERRIAQEAAE